MPAGRNLPATAVEPNGTTEVLYRQKRKGTAFARQLPEGNDQRRRCDAGEDGTPCKSLRGYPIALRYVRANVGAPAAKRAIWPGDFSQHFK